MKKGIMLEESDIKEILAKYFGVTEECVIKAKYSYIVIKEKEK